jgi:type I restriction enzyme, S subunit
MRALTPVDRAVAAYCDDWPRATVDQPEIARVNPETLAKATPPEFMFRYLDISSVSEGTVDWEAVLRLRFADAPSRARRVVRPGDTMISTVRPLLRSHTFADWPEQEPTVCSTGFAVVRCANGLVPRFLKHLPFAEQVTRQLVAWQCGTNYPAVNERDIRQLVVPVPPPAEQAAIARILDAVDTAVERTRAAVERARDLERSLLEDAFDKLHAPRLQLRAFTTDVRYGTSKASSDRGWGNPVLRIPNVVGDRLSLADLAFVELPSADASRLQLRGGDLLLVRTNGNPHYVGRSVVFRRPDARTWVYASYLIRVRLKAGLLPEFVNVFLGLERGRRELLRRVTTSAGNHNINSNSIRLLRLPVPTSEDAQARIVELAGACRAHVDALRSKAEALEQLKRSLMDGLFTGRVRVTREIKAVAS